MRKSITDKSVWIGRMVDNGKFFGKVIDCDPYSRDHYGNMPVIVLWENGKVQKTMSFWITWMGDENGKPVYAEW